MGIISSKREEDCPMAPAFLALLLGLLSSERAIRDEEEDFDRDEVRSFSSSCCGWTSIGVL